MSIKNNTIFLQSLLEQVNALPEASNDENLDTEISTQTTLLSEQNSKIAELAQVLASKASGGEQATPVISVNTSGLITATAGTKKSTYQLAFQAAKTITPNTTSQIAVSSGYYTGGNITVAGDSNLVAENIKRGINIFGVNGTLSDGSSGELVDYSEKEDAMVTRTLTDYTNNRVTIINGGAFAGCGSLISVNFPVCTQIKVFQQPGNYVPIGAFQGCYRLTTVSFPVCTTIGDYAFYGCRNLTTVEFPACTAIYSNAFARCDNLTTVNFPVCTIIGSSAFYGCNNLTTVSFPVCTTIGYDAFQGCNNLTTVSFPVCTIIGSDAFEYCDNLTTVNFPACTTISNHAFNYCSNLTTVSFPTCTTIGSNAFYNCYNLTTVNFPTCTTIYSNAFKYCYNLSQLYLTGSSLCTLSNSNAFTSTPYAGYSASFSGTPYIYVPQSLVTSYQMATNWTYFSKYFKAVEDAPNSDGNSSGNGSVACSPYIFIRYNNEPTSESVLRCIDKGDGQYTFEYLGDEEVFFEIVGLKEGNDYDIIVEDYNYITICIYFDLSGQETLTVNAVS